ncbi:MAG: DNA repair protein RecO [Thermodesulfobacteriota bacterium]|nr:DNA repair protein RecO [Thermodesulfobacteriota bacterium]
MPNYSTKAVVLHSFDYSEQDKIVTFFTRDFGKIKGIAKGAKKSKKRFSPLEIITLVSLSFFEKETNNLIRINNTLILDPYSGIKENFNKFVYGNYILELINEMTGEKEINPEAFDLLLDFLGIFDKQKTKKYFLRIFEIRLLKYLGYQPHLSTCLVCQKPLSKREDYFFCFDKGGIVCLHCLRSKEKTVKISLGTLKTLTIAQDYTRDKVSRLIFSREAEKESNEILPPFIEYHIGKRMKSLQFMEKVKINDNVG